MSQQSDPTRPWAHLLGEYRYLPNENAVLFGDGRKIPWEVVWNRLTGDTNASQGPSSRKSWARKPSLSRSHHVGTTISTFTDAVSGQEAKIESGESSQITPMELQKASISAHRRIVETRSSRGGTKYRVQKNPQGAFKLGNVIELLYPVESSDGNSAITAARDSESVMRVRRFVIIEPGSFSSAALAIHTYNSSGVAKPGLVKSDHVMIYTGSSPPIMTPQEGAVRLPSGEVDTLRPVPIQVIPDQNGTALDPMSRLNLREHYVIDHANEVHVFGSVSPGSQQRLIYQFREVTRSPHFTSPPQRSNGPASTVVDARASQVNTTGPRQSQNGENENGGEDNEDPQIVQLAIRVRQMGQQQGHTAATQALANCKQHDERFGTDLYPRLIAYLRRTAHLNQQG